MKNCAQYTALTKTTGFGAGRKAKKAMNIANEYYETHRSEITMYENAERYLKNVLRGHFAQRKYRQLQSGKPKSRS